MASPNETHPRYISAMMVVEDILALWPLRGARSAESPKKLKCKNIKNEIGRTRRAFVLGLTHILHELLIYISNNSRIAAGRLRP